MRYFKYLLLLVGFTLASCHSTQRLGRPSAPQNEAQLMEHLSAQMREHSVANPYRSARFKMRLSLNDKRISCHGQLKMKRDDVIQLSLTLLGLEVGRIEFTPEEVLVIDRLHKQYMRERYDQVRFLRETQLNFYTLQALFWDRLFVPTSAAMSDRELYSPHEMKRFRLSQAGDHSLLTLKKSKRLDYLFLVHSQTGIIDRITLQSQKQHHGYKLDWQYSDFAPLDGQPVPQNIHVNVNAAEKQLEVDFSMGSWSQKEGWSTRTKINRRYVQRQLSDVAALLLQLTQ